MDLSLKEAMNIDFTGERDRWIDDPQVSSYIYLSEKESAERDPGDLTNFKKYYEIYDGNKLVGDIKLFYESEEDILQQRAQILMVVGERNRGVGTHALSMLLEKEKKNYKSVYCEIHRSNIASLKILKRNGFQIDRMEGARIFLSRSLN